MGLVFNPLDVTGGPSPMAPTVSPVTRSIVQALLAKHGGAAVAQPAAVPTPAPAAAPAMPPVDDTPPPVNVAPPTMSASVPNGDSTLSSPVSIKKPGMLDRIGDYLKSDDGRATMMRFAAGAFNGGIGGGLTAATNFADQRRAQEVAATTEAQKLALEQAQIGNTYNLGLGKLGIESETSGENARHNRATEGAQVYGINSENARSNLATGEKRFEHVTPSGDAVTAQTGENYRHDNASGDVTTQQAGENQRSVAKNQTDIQVANIGHPSPTSTVHLHYTTTPGLFAAMHGAAMNAVRPSMVRPNPAPTAAGQPQAGQPVRVSNDADYANLQSGTPFIGPDGVPRVKP